MARSDGGANGGTATVEWSGNTLLLIRKNIDDFLLTFMPDGWQLQAGNVLMMSSTPTSTHPPQMLNPYFYRRLREMKENQFQQFPISNPLLLAVLLPISAPYAAASALHPHFVGGG